MRVRLHIHLEAALYLDIDFYFPSAWSAYWLPILQALTTQCTNSCRDVRQLSFSALQRSLLSPDLTCSDPKEWTAIFSQVLFPLIFRLLKPEVFSSDRDGMSEMRVQVSSLLCKVFLQYMVLLSEWDGMLDLWVKIIEIMDRLMNSGQGDSLVSFRRQHISCRYADELISISRLKRYEKILKMLSCSWLLAAIWCLLKKMHQERSSGTRLGRGLIDFYQTCGMILSARRILSPGKPRMTKKNDRRLFLVRGQVTFIPYNDNTYVGVRCKNILHSFRWSFYVQRLARRESQQADRPPSSA